MENPKTQTPDPFLAAKEATAQVGVAEALRKSEERFHNLADTAPAMLWVTEPDGSCPFLSRGWYEFTGQSEQEGLGKDGFGWLDAVHPEDYERAARMFVDANEKRLPFTLDYRLRRHDGDYRWAIDEGHPRFGPNGEFLGYIGSVLDITERKRDEEAALRQSEEQFRALFNQTTGGIAQTDVTGRFTLVNNRYCDIVGRSREELLTLRMHDITHSDDVSANADQFRALTQGGPSFVVETRYLRPDGSAVWVHNDVAAVRDSHGRVSHIVAAVRDITEQKRNEETLHDLNATLEARVDERTKTLRQEKERFHSAFDHAPIGMALVAPDGRCLRVNRSLCEIVGYTEAELLAVDFQTITHLEADLAHIRDMLAGTIHTYQVEKQYVHKRGHIIHILLAVSLVRDPERKPLYFIAQIKDITEQKQAETQLKASLQEKEVLLKEVHHRVKNNLQIISTLFDLQSDHTQNRQVLELFREGRARVRSMALIHERLYGSQDLARVDFREYVRQLVQDLYHTYKVSDDDIALYVEIAVPPLPLGIAIPCGLLLNELISNCLKHGFKDSSQGWIRVTLRGDGPNNVLTVADDGVGFPQDLDFRNTTSFGMQLINTLVEQLKGKIELVNNRGTVVTITFPGHDRSQEEPT